MNLLRKHGKQSKLPKTADKSNSLTLELNTRCS